MQLIHDNSSYLLLADNTVVQGNTEHLETFQGTEQGCQAEIARLRLVPKGQMLSTPRRQKMKVTAAAAKQALLKAGLYTSWNLDIQALPDCPLKLLWNGDGNWYRLDPLVLEFTKQKGLSPEQVDALFLSCL